MRSVEAEGATIDEAIEHALSLLHIERDKVEIAILESSSRGLLGFGGKKARVRATVRNPLSVGAPTGDEPVSRETVPAPTATADVERTRAAFSEILKALGLDPTFATDHSADGWRFSLASTESGIVIGRHGQTLDAIEYLLNRIASHGDRSTERIAIDVEGYRERRQESVEITARRAAEKARQTGRPVTLPPMSPRDRRTVHVALSDERGVTTQSEGEGSYRRVIVAPARTSER
jgi:spoIIIJ-associated protein